MLESQPLELEKNKKNKAQQMYLKGKIMDFLPEYSKQAEENLSKSIKLMPTKKEAWDALAHVYWKKRDIEQAKRCFESSIELDQENKTALTNLSMVLRSLTTSSTGEPIDSEERKKNFVQSIDLAKKAIALDMKDSHSWYVLGNAHLTNFFQNNMSPNELQSALAAYSQSERS